MDAAHAAVDAIPVLPVTKAYIGISVPTPEVVKASVRAAMGALIVVDPDAAAHVHTPHCEHAAPSPAPPASAPQPSAPHVCTPRCNHKPAPKGTVWAAANAGDVPALLSALSRGDSTEEADSSGDTALAQAAYNGHTDAVVSLMSAGASVVSKDKVRA